MNAFPSTLIVGCSSSLSLGKTLRLSFPLYSPVRGSMRLSMLSSENNNYMCAVHMSVRKSKLNRYKMPHVSRSRVAMRNVSSQSRIPDGSRTRGISEHEKNVLTFTKITGLLDWKHRWRPLGDTFIQLRAMFCRKERPAIEGDGRIPKLSIAGDSKPPRSTYSLSIKLWQKYLAFF